MNFDKCVESYNHRCHHDVDYLPLSLCSQFPAPSFGPWQTLISVLSLQFAFLEFHINGTMQNVIFRI